VTAAPSITGWRAQVQRLAPLALPLLPCGAGFEFKAPMNTVTGKPLYQWELKSFTTGQIIATPRCVRSVGARTGSGFLCFDVDGATAVALCLEQGCDPHQAPTWRVERDTDQARLKVNWSLTAQQQLQLGAANTKAHTRHPNRDADGNKTDGDKGEAVEVFHNPGRQVVVLGEHVLSGGNYLWPDGHGPEAYAPIPPAWWEMALAIVRGDLGIGPEGRGAAAPATTTTTTRASKSSSAEWAPTGTPADPCPICRRNTTGYCSRHKVSHTIRCFHGSTFNPEISHGIMRRPGQKVTGTDGVFYGFCSIQTHKSGDAFSVFKVHEERPEVDPFQDWPESEDDQPDPVDEVGAKREEKAQSGAQQQEKTKEPPKPPQPRKSWEERNKRKLSHTRAMRCFDRCVEVQAQQQRNSLTRRARLLKALHDLGLSKYVNRAEISQKVLEAKDRQQGRCFKAITSAERLAMERPTVSWLIPGILPDRDASIIGGRAKVGKTRLAYALAAAVLTGKPVFGFEAPAPRPVIVISDDQGDGDTADMFTELGIWDHPKLIWSRHFRLTESDLDQALLTIKEYPGALLIFDSLRSISRSLQEGENDPEIGAIIYDLKEAVVEAGGAPVLIHHCNKADGQIGMEALSGHNAIAGAANTILTVTYLPDEKGKPQKDDQQRRLHREARSGKPFDLVIAPAAGGTFERVADFGEWVVDQKKVGSEQEALGKMPTVNVKILAVLCSDREKWFTRREVCEARGVPWGDRGRGPEVQKVTRALQRLVKENFAESKRDGQEASFRAAGGGGEPHMGQKSDDTNDSDDIQ